MFIGIVLYFQILQHVFKHNQSKKDVVDVTTAEEIFRQMFLQKCFSTQKNNHQLL